MRSVRPRSRRLRPVLREFLHDSIDVRAHRRARLVRTDNPLRAESVTHVSGINRYLCDRNRPLGWWPRAELNHRHKDFQSSALPTELLGHLNCNGRSSTHASSGRGGNYISPVAPRCAGRSCLQPGKGLCCPVRIARSGCRDWTATGRRRGAHRNQQAIVTIFTGRAAARGDQHGDIYRSVELHRSGIRTVKDTTKRADAVEETARKMGIETKSLYWTVGKYDVVATFEAPDDASMTALSLAISSRRQRPHANDARVFEGRNDRRARQAGLDARRSSSITAGARRSRPVLSSLSHCSDRRATRAAACSASRREERRQARAASRRALLPRGSDRRRATARARRSPPRASRRAA